MENKFKSGDIVYLYKEITTEDWNKHNMTAVQIPFNINDKLIVLNHSNNSYNSIKLKGQGHNWYPDSCFKLYNPLKLELNKLKETILNSRVTITKEERKKFESICKMLDIKISEGSLRLTETEYQDKSDAQVDIIDDCIVYKYNFKEDKTILFKDLIEPFKRFKDEVL